MLANIGHIWGIINTYLRVTVTCVCIDFVFIQTLRFLHMQIVQISGHHFKPNEYKGNEHFTSETK